MHTVAIIAQQIEIYTCWLDQISQEATQLEGAVQGFVSKLE